MRGGAGRSSTRPGRSSTAGSSCRIDETRRCPWSRRVSYPCPRWSRRCSRPRSAPRPGRRVPASCRPAAWCAATGAEQRAAERLAAAIAGAERTALVRLAEPGGRWFERVAAAAGLPLVDGDLTAIAGGRPVDDVVTSWLCLAALTGAGLQLRGVGELAAPDHRRLGEAFRSFDGTVVALVYDAPCPDIESDCPAVVLRRPELDVGERIDMWSSAAAGSGLVLSEVDATALASTLPLGPSEIADAVARFAVQPLEAGEPTARRLRQIAIDQRSDALPPTVRSIATRFAWDDLVLADPAKAELRSIATHFTLSASVLDRWGFVDRLTYGRGVSALFSGASGTGKTMAAQVLARELGVELLLVDLSKTVSKYLGETEKNIDTAFRVAERRGALLLFDEADALFGKRSEVKDAHDRHANVEVAYLLQRMEAFEGIAILTTNLKQNIDDAFLRRLRFLVDFPLPDAAAREVIWRQAFPERAPLVDDIDFGFLGASAPADRRHHPAGRPPRRLRGRGGRRRHRDAPHRRRDPARARQARDVRRRPGPRGSGRPGGCGMSADAIADLTSAIRNRIEAAVGASKRAHRSPGQRRPHRRRVDHPLPLPRRAEPGAAQRRPPRRPTRRWSRRPPRGVRGPAPRPAVRDLGLPPAAERRRPRRAPGPRPAGAGLGRRAHLHRPGAARPDGAAHARALPDGGDEPGVGPVSRRRRTRRRSCTWPPR